MRRSRSSSASTARLHPTLTHRLCVKMRAAARSAFPRRGYSMSRSDSVHIRTTEEMLLFDVSLEGWGTAMWTGGPVFIITSPSPRSSISPRPPARPSKTATLPFASSTASPSPLHTHITGTPRRKCLLSLFETAATLVEKALDKRALNLSRDSRNEMRMAARQNKSPSRSILTCSHHPSHHTLVSLFQHLLSHLIFVPALSRLQFSSVTAFHVQSDVEFFQLMMSQKNLAIALVASQFLKEYSFIRKEE
ncbi:hypothetical protein BLNAU_3892 [Blattamonas nauphoetae]|uniref:Uncharacterized protein n=1 Tax=Blattamonas nauphoetae TaxID=2049346 RepID=A0ABQ9YBL9_9EUKA|nr:hypothetical protein BLNAU_3892 [Blattamonas nauphoetae]